MSDLYDDDMLSWSEQQAALLRRLATGESVNEPPDWSNIAEEIESLGRNDVRAVASLLVQALLHELKCQAWPQLGAVPGWKAEARVARNDARDIFTESMRQRLDAARICARARDGLPDAIDGVPPLPIEDAPLTLDELLAEPG